MNLNKRILLGVNIDHIATVRQARGTRYPDPVKAALDAEQAGADGITVHLREDRRHIQDRDVRVLREVMGRVQGSAKTDNYGKTTYRDAQGRVKGTTK